MNQIIIKPTHVELQLSYASGMPAGIRRALVALHAGNKGYNGRMSEFPWVPVDSEDFTRIIEYLGKHHCAGKAVFILRGDKRVHGNWSSHAMVHQWFTKTEPFLHAYGRAVVKASKIMCKYLNQDAS